MKKIAVFVAAVICALCIFSGCGNNEKQAETTTASQETKAETVETKSETFLIETPYCMMKLPEKWREKIKIKTASEKPFKLEFSSGGTALFDIIVDGKDGKALGTLKADDKSVKFSYVKHNIEKKAENRDKLLEFQGGVEFIADNLEKDYDFTKAK